jgi:hypothetical protein
VISQVSLPYAGNRINQQRMKIQAYLRISVIFLSLIHFCRGAAICQVIDMHMHGYTEKDFATGVARNGFESSKSAKEHLEQTIYEMDKNKIEYAVICGTIESLGSDQMIWPSAISSSIHFLNSLDFLTEEEKQMILYKNAKVFLGTMDITSGNNSKK